MDDLNCECRESFGQPVLISGAVFPCVFLCGFAPLRERLAEKGNVHAKVANRKHA
jgi:hypothetical protein